MAREEVEIGLELSLKGQNQSWQNLEVIYCDNFSIQESPLGSAALTDTTSPVGRGHPNLSDSRFHVFEQ